MCDICYCSGSVVELLELMTGIWTSTSTVLIPTRVVRNVECPFPAAPKIQRYVSLSQDNVVAVGVFVSFLEFKIIFNMRKLQDLRGSCEGLSCHRQLVICVLQKKGWRYQRRWLASNRTLRTLCLVVSGPECKSESKADGWDSGPRDFLAEKYS